MVCFDDLDGIGNSVKFNEGVTDVKRSGETDQIILDLRDRNEWIDRIIREGLNSFVLGHYLDRDFIGWIKVPNLYKMLKGKEANDEHQMDGNSINFFNSCAQ